MVRRPLWLSSAIAATVSIACADPSDVLYTRAVTEPVEVQPGLFRLTFNSAPDYVRGFTPTGDTVLYRAPASGPSGGAWQILGLPAGANYGAEEHAALYRLALFESFMSLVTRPDRRLLLMTQPGDDGSFNGPAGCKDPFRHMQVWRLDVLRLQPEDGEPLSGVPKWSVLVPNVDTVVLPPQFSYETEYRLRFTLGEVEAENGANPYGPAMDPLRSAYYSTGETVWRVDLTNSGAAPDSLGAGVFPAISLDGRFMASAVPEGVDSVIPPPPVLNPLQLCYQWEVTFTTTGWTTHVVQLENGDTVATVAGTEPVFDPTGTRIVVRRPAGLVWVDLATRSESPVPYSDGAFGVAVSPDGAFLAFSKSVNGNVDVYYEKLK